MVFWASYEIFKRLYGFRSDRRYVSGAAYQMTRLCCSSNFFIATLFHPIQERRSITPSQVEIFEKRACYVKLTCSGKRKRSGRF